jgi:hypothetical protein
VTPYYRLPLYEIERDGEGKPVRMHWTGWEPNAEEKLLAAENGWRTELAAREQLQAEVYRLRRVAADAKALLDSLGPRSPEDIGQLHHTFTHAIAPNKLFLVLAESLAAWEKGEADA